MAGVQGNGTSVATGVYTHAIGDAAGLVALNVFAAFYNPPSSPRVHVSLEALVSAYSIGATAVADSLTVKRFTSYSGGTLVTPANVGRFVSTMPDPVTQVITGNPVLTGTTARLANFPPPISTVAATGAVAGQGVVPGASFTMLPGQGLAFFTPAGNVNQVWNIQYVWEEI